MENIQSLESARSYRQEYKVKGWVDARDCGQKWRLGRIKKILDGKVLISFDGWSEKYNQTYCEHSDNIAPLRMYTRGYTGQSKITLRDCELQTSNIKLMEHKMTLLKHTKLKAFSAYEITSFLRADLFILIDDILTRAYVNPAEELQFFTSFFTAFLELYKMWATLAPSLLEQRARTLAGKPHSLDQLYLSNKSIAGFDAGYELSLSLASMFGCDRRTQDFYPNYGTHVHRTDLVEEFLNNGGLLAFTQVLKTICIERNDSGEYVPIEMLWPAVVTIPSLFSITTINANTSYLSAFSEALINRILSITPQEAEALSKDAYRIELLGNNLRQMFALQYNEPTAQKILERILGQFRPYIPLHNKIPHEFSFAATSPPMKEPPMSCPPASAELLLPRAEPAEVKMPDRNEENYQMLKSELAECRKRLSELTLQLKDQGQLEQPATEAPGQAEGESGKKQPTLPPAHVMCDRQESVVLTTIKHLLLKGKVDEARKLIVWRKEVIDLAEQSGWELAAQVAKRTGKKMTVEAVDVIKAGLTLCKKMRDFQRETKRTIPSHKNQFPNRLATMANRKSGRMSTPIHDQMIAESGSGTRLSTFTPKTNGDQTTPVQLKIPIDEEFEDTP